MPLQVFLAHRAVMRRLIVSALLFSLTGSLGILGPAAQAVTQGASSLSEGQGYACAIESGKAYCWGDNAFGDLGDGRTTNSTVPVRVDTSGVLAGKTLTQISAGNTETCALDNAGAAYCWGWNSNGQLGNGGPGGYNSYSSVPVAVDTSGALAGKTLTQIAVGQFDACAVDTYGAAYCWGNNFAGQLGNGTTNSSSVPVPVESNGVLAGKALTQVGVGLWYACALDSAGAAYCWGGGGVGVLGDGSTNADSTTPVPVDTSGALAGKTLTQISVGNEDACALDRAGHAYCWGDNGFGQLGYGPPTASVSNVPVTVDASGLPQGKTLTQINAGMFATCALDSGGAAYCWGDNAFGALGDNSTVNGNVPTPVDTQGALKSEALTEISAGYDDTCAQDSNGAMYCWGDNTYGGLGNSKIKLQSNVPVLVGPQSPTKVITYIHGRSAVVFWRAPAWLDSGRLTGFTATAYPGRASCRTTGVTQCVITGLANGTGYRITVVAHTTVGNSGASAPAAVIQAPLVRAGGH